jgi:DNA-binding transcriptional regulator LsrR (DeoR family)
MGQNVGMPNEQRSGAAASPRRELDRATQIRLADVARAYFLDGRSKIEIAADFSLSRFQVAKMLDDARANGIVSIEIRDPRKQVAGLDDELALILGVRRVQIVEVTDDDLGKNTERVGIAVMELMREMVRPNMTVGISWSRALDSAARFLPDLPPCNIVQLAGALHVYGAGFIPRMMAQLSENPRIHTYPISAPLVVDEPATARDLMRQPEIADALSLADDLDLAVVAIGAWKSGESTVWDKVSQADRDAGTRSGAVAEISGRLVGAMGQPVHTDLGQRTIGVTIEQLAKASQVIAVARGVGRVDAVVAAAKSNIVTCLVLDSGLAAAILRHAKGETALV